jgi:hypothetical protein
MKEIKLTQGQVALVDDEDFDRVNQYKWYAHWIPSTRSFYAKYKNIAMARFIINCPEDLRVDHKDHDTLNNQKFNLRACTIRQNGQNSRRRSNCTSKYKGVSWRRDRTKWQAYIQTENIFGRSMRMHLGCFKTEKEAAQAYDKAASREFGEFAYLNFS